MAVPEFIENVTFRARSGVLFAYDGERLIGQVSSVDGGVHVKLMGKPFRSRPPRDDAAIAIDGVAANLRNAVDAIERLRDALVAANVADGISTPKKDA